jgi:hypothetical protein
VNRKSWPILLPRLTLALPLQTGSKQFGGQERICNHLGLAFGKVAFYVMSGSPVVATK